MYQVFFDDYPLYDPRDQDLLIRNPSVHLAVGEAGEMSFTIDSSHPYADKLTRLKGVVRLLADGGTILTGRIRKDTLDFRLSREIEVEGLLACLNDSVIPPFAFPEDFLGDPEYQAAADSGNVVRFFLSWLLRQHNSQVGATQKIHLGDVTVTDPNNYIHRASSDYGTTMDVIRSKLSDLMGGYLLADYSGATTVLHYYADLPLTNTQVVAYGENLLDLVSELDATEMYTAVLPIGQDGLTIEGLPDGEISPGIVKSGRVIYSQDAEEICGGRITKVVKWNDVTVDANLRTKATALLTSDGILTTQTIAVKAADLAGVAGGSVSGDPRTSAVVGKAVAGLAVVGTAAAGVQESGASAVRHFVVGRYVRLQSSPHGFGATFPLMELEPDILNPGNTTLTLGATIKSASDMAHDDRNNTREEFDRQWQEFDRQEGNITEIAKSVSAQITSAIQTCESIIFSALSSYVETSNFEEYKETVSSQLAIMANEISINLTTVTEQIESVNGDLQSKYESITKYFRFTSDGLIIGETGNEVLLRLDNDIVQFLRANVPELYMDASGVHAEELHAKTVRIGSYVLQGEVDGRITLRKAGA